MPKHLALLILGKLGGLGRRKRSKRKGKEVESETKVVAIGALTCFRTGSCCCSVGSTLEEGLPPPFSANLASMMMMAKRRAQPVEFAAFEAGGSPRQLLAGGGTLMGGEEVGKAQSHLEEVGSSQVLSQGDEYLMVVVGEEGMGTQRLDGQFAAPGVPMGGLPSSASLALEGEQEVWRNPSKVNLSLMKSWMTFLFEEPVQIY